MSSKAILLLNAAKRQGIRISVDDGELELKLSKANGIDPRLLQEIKDNREMIIEFLSAGQWRATKPDESQKNLKPYPRTKGEKIPLSFSQERLWFVDQLEGSIQYHVPAVLRMRGKLNKEALEYALLTVVQRHEAVRSVILQDQGTAYQEILPPQYWKLQVTDVFIYKNDQEGLKQYIDQLICRPFDLSKDYLLRAALLCVQENDFILVLTLHHIASDGWSVSVLVRELVSLYESYITGSSDRLEALPVQYADFAIWQRKHLQGQVLDTNLTYWKQKLAGVAALQLPADYPRPLFQSTAGAVLPYTLSKELSDRIAAVAQQQGATLFMTLLAAFKTLLFRCSGQQDICVGTPITGRQQFELEALIGFFVNTLALRTCVKGGYSFTELLDQVKQTTIEAYEHQEAPFEKVAEVVVRDMDMSRSPLFQVMFVVHNNPEVQEIKLPDLDLSKEKWENKTSKFDITFFIRETPAGLQGSVEYNTALYKEQTIRKMVAHFQTLLEAVTENPAEKIDLLPILTLQEKHELLITFNNTAAKYPVQQSITGLFEEQVSKTPDAKAIVFEGKSITYDELNKRSNTLAHYLRSKGVKPDTLVPVCIERSMEMVIGVIAVLKAGGAYVPVDPDYPVERIVYIMEDVKAALIVTTKADRKHFPAADGLVVVEVDGDWPGTKTHPSTNPEKVYQPHHLTYLLYTSGSTGTPKGVQMPGAALVNLICWQEKQFAAGNRRVLQFASLNFDASFHEIFSTLCSGSTLFLISAERRKDVAELLKDLLSYQITHLFVPYVVLKNLAENIASLPHAALWLDEVMVAGEQLKLTDDISSLLGKHIGRIVNQYGPTEAHVVSSYTIGNGGPMPALPPIGKPIDNTQLYILSPARQLVPVGVTGELYIGGVQVAHGYLHKPQQTAEKFIRDFISNRDNARLYKTGDLARWLPDGNIEYLGRTDDQVKIRGFRIELGEIETILQQCDLVEQAVVVAKEDIHAGKRLIAYIVPKGVFDKEKITDFLKSKLPAYMVPALWVELERLPLTANGKVDKKMLPDPVAGAPGDGYIPPGNKTEEALVEIWQDLLGAGRISAHDHFFELGGHSLLAVRVVSAVRSRLKKDVPLKDLFLYPTLSAFATHLISQDEKSVPLIVAAEPRPEYIPLSFGQERLWFIDKLEGSIQYHLPSILKLQGKLNTDILDRCFRYLIDRHEILRTIIVEEQGKPHQVIRKSEHWTLHVAEWDASGSDPDLEYHIRQLIEQPFDLSRHFMLRVHLIRLGEQEHILVIILHHIAADGWSRSIFVQELVELYTAWTENRPLELAPLPVQYADYALWQRNHLEAVLKEKLAYWIHKLEAVPALQFPTDHPRPEIQSNKGAIIVFTLDQELTGQLKALSRQEGTTLFMTLLAAFKVLLYRYSAQADICVGTSAANRTMQQLEGLIGFFINTLAIRSDLSGNPSFVSLLQQLKTTTLDAFEHQDVPFEKVVEAVVKERDTSRNPLFQLLFSLQNGPDLPGVTPGDLTVTPVAAGHTTSQLDMVWNIAETAQGLTVSVEYCTALFRVSTIRRMTGYFENLLHSVVASPQQFLSMLNMMDDQERFRLLFELGTQKQGLPAAGNTLVSRFEEQVARNLSRNALIHADRQLSFEQLNEKANQLARHLQAMSVKQEQLVGVFMEAGPEMMIALLGILKAGAAYMCIDVSVPEQRISYLLQDSAASLVIANAGQQATLSACGFFNVVVMDLHGHLISTQSTDNLYLPIHASQLAYVIYTSGSSGKPKGVMIEHGSIYRYLMNSRTRYINELSSQGSGSFAHLSYMFDASLTALFMPLLFGKTVVISSANDSAEAFEDDNFIRYAPYDFIKITPAHLPLLAPRLHTQEKGLLTSTLVIGGEALLASQLTGLTEGGEKINVINEYGPTEATVGCSTYSFETGQTAGHEYSPHNNNIPIGKPIDGVRLYVVGSNTELLPVDIAGELCIGGEGLARGYLNLQESTAARFIDDPFTEQQGARMYKTGDLAKWTEEGVLVYLGRQDEQVKIRGYRVELGEIEGVLMESGFVRQVAVVVKQKEGAKRLVAYVVGKDSFSQEETMRYLQDRLPEYMVPQQWIELEEMPLTRHGKLDRQALKEKDVATQESPRYTAPRNKLEQDLVAIWQELLEVETIGIHDNFFELGGDSIIIIQIVSRARRAGYEFQVADVFSHQTIAGLSALISRQTEDSAVVSAEQNLLEGEAGLLPIQQWYFETAGENVSYYNQSFLFSIHKAVTVPELHWVVRELTTHHDALRFTYRRAGAQWIQQYGTSANVPVIEDLTGIESSFNTTVAEKLALHQQSLDIEKGELMRIVMVLTPQEITENRLFIVIHHLAVDGVSWRILLEDISFLLNGIKNGEKTSLGKKSTSYKNWYTVLEKWGQSKAVTSQRAYWDYVVKCYQPLPVDKECLEAVRARDTSHHIMRLDEHATGRLIHEVPQVYHTEINDLLLAALAKTLTKFSGTSKTTIGMEGHGREPVDKGIDTTRTVGWFTTHYPVLLEIDPGTDTDGLIKTVKEQLRKIPEKGLGFGVLKYLNKEEAYRGKPCWDLVFNYHGQGDNVLNTHAWLGTATEHTGSGIDPEREVEKLAVTGIVREKELVLHWTYSHKHYRKETVLALADGFIQNLKQLITHCLIRLESRKAVHTPSDYGLGYEISYQELDAFLQQPFRNKPRSASLESIYRLSGLQEGMLFHGLYDRGIGAYVEQLGCDLAGVDFDIFSRSWTYLLKRHSILRSAFHFNKFSIPVQCVYKDPVVPIELLDHRELTHDEQHAVIAAYKEADRNKGIDFAVAPLMRMALFRLSDDRYHLVWTSHHILFDGWSFSVLMEEFLTTYELLSAGKEPVIEREDRYEDYIRYLERRSKNEEELYWRNYLRGVEQNTLLPFVAVTNDRNKGAGTYQKLLLNIDTGTSSKIQAYAQNLRITVNTLMQGVWAYLLHRYTGLKEIVYGIVVSGRPGDLSGVEQRVGMYINTLLFHAAVQEDREIEAWLCEIQASQVSSRHYQHTPLHLAQEWSGVPGDLFDTLLTFENYPVSKVIASRQWTLNASGFHIEEQTNYPLSILITSAEQISILFSYNTRLLDEAYVNMIRGHFEHVLLQLVTGSCRVVGEINLLTIAEKQLLSAFNPPATASPPDKTVVDFFEEQVAGTPNNLAIVFRSELLLYAELNVRANRLARYLQSKGVQEEMLVPICLDQSTDMLISIWAVLKAGGAYVPLDPQYPKERIAYILNDIKATVVITNQANLASLPESYATQIVELDRDSSVIERFESRNLMLSVRENHAAYCIYTSGSTGQPKGVLVEHRSLLNYLLNSKTSYISSEDNMAGSFIHLPFTFDASVTALFMPLLHGKFVVVGAKQSINVFDDDNLFAYAPYDFIKITPSHLELLQPAFKAFGKVGLAGKLVIGGEALHPGHLESFVRDAIDVEIINEYGPTEATVGCTTYSFQAAGTQKRKKISIGKPVDNTEIQILDDRLQQVPVGVKGEICISGAGLSCGYLGQPALTDNQFVRNPFSSSGGRMYKTGDVGCWLPDGNIEYLGRKDEQLKVLGYRIEPGEIEHALHQSEAVNQVVVIGKEDAAGHNRLVGYYVPELAALRSKESELGNQRIGNWKELYETEYSQTENNEDTDPEFNIVGWNDSFTGQAIPALHMKEWLDDIVRVVLDEQPAHVLEIGCGTGLIYYRLAGRIRKYIGSDLSASSIRQIRNRISEGRRNYGETILFTKAAHEVTLADDQPVDTILLNSIAQYFPSEEYANAVIDRCIGMIGKKGRIIIGDVRDSRLLDLFKGRLRLEKLPDATSVNEFRWAFEQDMAREEELCFSPVYFYQLKKRYPQITHTDIQWKSSSSVNELTLYRYTVVVYVGIEKPIHTVSWQNWDDVTAGKNLFGDDKELPGVVALAGVPNPRLWKERLLQQALQEPSFRTVGEVTANMQTADPDTKLINQLTEQAGRKGYSCRLFVHEDALKTNLLFEHHPSGSFIQQPLFLPAQGIPSELTNIPLFTEISILLQQDIRRQLLHRLPAYMVPAEFHALRQLPLTANGKIDRVFLGQREEKVYAGTNNYQPPATDTEWVLAGIWKELLHIERIGLQDNFFELGGHSLLAMRAVAAVRKELVVELGIKEIFTFPTILLLSGYIDKQRKGSLMPPVEVVSPRPDCIPLSFSQERLWFIDQLEGSRPYHIPAVLKLNGHLDVTVLSDAFRHIINRHEVLRTVIHAEHGYACQVVKEKNGWNLSVVDGAAYRQDAVGLQLYIQQLINSPFDLRSDDMLRAVLIRLDKQDHILVITLHHIASDGWSAALMVGELAEIYNAGIQNREPILTFLPVQYADYAVWQRKYLQGSAWDKKLAYWKTKLEGTPHLQLPTDYPRPFVQSTRGATVDFRIDPELYGRLKLLSQQQGTTLYMTLLAAFNVLLYHYSGQTDICIGTPTAGRLHQEVEGLVGFFVNTLALRCRFEETDQFLELLQQVKSTTLEGYEHQEIPFEKVVELTVRERNMNRSPLFQVMMVLQNVPPLPAFRLGEVQLTVEEIPQTVSMFDLTLTVKETAYGLAGTWEYCSDLYAQQTIQRMAAQYAQLLTSIVSQPDQSIRNLSILPRSERHQLLVDFNNTSFYFSTHRTVVELFEEQVVKTPDNIAVECGQHEISYRQLSELSGRLAYYLKGKGVGAETMVPVCIDRSVELIVGILAILKAGGAYVPVDPGYPEYRIKFILQDTNARIMLVSRESRRQLPVLEGVELVDAFMQEDSLNPQIIQRYVDIEPAHLAYVTYTSGSTGLPKGVMIEHASLLNYVQQFVQYFSICSDDTVIQQSSPSFDTLVEELYPALVSGGCIHVIGEGGKDIHAIKNCIESGKATILAGTPMVIDYLNKELSDTGRLRYFIIGGDVLHPSHIDQLLEKVAFVNGYGPSETTVCATYNRITKVSEAPFIGKPLRNASIYIAGSGEGILAPVGVPGEIYIGGAGVARGYLNNPALTEQKFVPNHFDSNAHARLFRTGDLGRWLPDGTIEFLGRKDEQVKIRGYRVEPGEVEHVLQQCKAVRQAVVMTKEDKAGDKRLVGYVVPQGAFERSTIVAYLKEKLPGYMIPSGWIEMERLPFTSTGKIDRKALPEPDVNLYTKKEYAPARTTLEEKLVEIWQEVLQMGRIGIHDDFFELGGHSLLAMKMKTRIESALRISVPVKVLFQFTCISDLSKYLEIEVQYPLEKSDAEFVLYDV